MYIYTNMENEILQDKKIGNKKVIDWKGHKLNSLDLADSFMRLGNSKSYRVSQCGNLLEFKKFEDDTLKLHLANFCKVRLCPMCAWRRSLKIFGQVSRVMDAMLLDYNYKFLFLTLTCKNVNADELSLQIDFLFKAFNLLTKRKKFKKSVKGWFRCLEVTYNCENDTFHPHFHCVLAVNSSYFDDKDYYIKQSDWCDLWRSCLNVDYTPIVDVRRFKDSDKGVGKEVAEVSKYAVKTTDFIIKRPNGKIIEDVTDYLVSTFDMVLANRRLIAFGGIFKELHKKLNLDDTEDGDLIHVGDDEELREDLNYIIIRYKWQIGAVGNNYYKY